MEEKRIHTSYKKQKINELIQENSDELKNACIELKNISALQRINKEAMYHASLSTPKNGKQTQIITCNY
jgi:hypothetical protein